MNTTRDDFAKLLWALARSIPRFAPNLEDKALLDVWYAQLGSFHRDELAAAFKASVRKFDCFPSIRELLELLGAAEPDEEDQSREVADRIFAALNGGGSAWPRERLESHLGPIGSEVVRQLGGFRAVSDATDNDNVETMKAQWRGSARALIRRARSGGALDAPPDFDRLNPKVQAALQAAGQGVVAVGPPKKP